MTNFVSIKKIASEFSIGAKVFCRNPKEGVRRYGANIAGGVWIAGSCVEMALGTIAADPISQAASVALIASSVICIPKGHKDWFVSLSSGLGIFGVGLLLSPKLIQIDPIAWGSFTFYTATEAFSLFGGPLVKRFQNSKNPIVYNIFGYPRRTSGFGLLSSRLMGAADCALRGKPWDTVPFLIWGAADIFYAFSREEARQVPAKNPAPAL